MEASVVVVEAAAGYGKTVLGAELADAWRSVAVEVTLHEGGVSAQLFAARLRAAAASAGFSEAAGTMAEAGEDAPGAVEALLGALAAERCAFVIDDAYHAQRDAGLLIDRLAEQLQPHQHLVVLARRLPPGTARLRRADCVQLTAADLALRSDETLALCRAGFGLDVGPAEVAALERATGGWTAAAALAGTRARSPRWPATLAGPPARWARSWLKPSTRSPPASACCWPRSAGCRCSTHRWSTRRPGSRATSPVL